MSLLSQSPALILRVVLGAASGTPLPHSTPGPITVPTAALPWPAYVGHLPDGDDISNNVVGMFDREGPKQGRLMRGEVIERRAVQIIVRSSVYRDGYKKVLEINQALDEVLRLGIDTGNFLYSIPAVRRGTVLPMGQDQNSKRPRFLFSLNTDFNCFQEGPYEEWGNENGELYTAIYNLHKLVHVDYPTWFPA